MKIDIERCSDGSAQNRTENGVGTVASGTVSGGWSPLHGASAGISDPSYQSLVGRDGWERREGTAFDDLHCAGGGLAFSSTRNTTVWLGDYDDLGGMPKNQPPAGRKTKISVIKQIAAE